MQVLLILVGVLKTLIGITNSALSVIPTIVPIRQLLNFGISKKN